MKRIFGRANRGEISEAELERIIMNKVEASLEQKFKGMALKRTSDTVIKKRSWGIYTTLVELNGKTFVYYDLAIKSRLSGIAKQLQSTSRKWYHIEYKGRGHK